MNNKIQSILKYTCLSASVLITSSCNDFLDREPLDQVTPGQFFTTEADLAAYAIASYNFPSAGGWNLGDNLLRDNNTDNQATTNPSLGLWVPEEWRVPQYGGWSFGNIRNANYFFEKVIPNWKAGKIQGSDKNIEHYIGEMYFMRAYEYFKNLVSYGDFPIVKNTLLDNHEELIAASKRSPRNEVAKFILADLDSSIILMNNDPVGKKNRLTRNAALLFKSRVALYEATWLKYHQGTARVPGGPGWPGARMDYNKDFSIDLDGEIKFFLSEAMESSSEVADQVSLEQSTGITNPTGSAYSGWNPYFDLFNAQDMNPIEEVIMWRSYSSALNICHAITTYLLSGGGNTGYTKSLVDGFLMKNGLPIYAANSGYAGEDSLELVKKDRDDRLQLFMRAPSDLRTVNPQEKKKTFGIPAIVDLIEVKSVTGYDIRKCLTYDPSQPTSSITQTYGTIVFRGVEAYLNYIEACYEKNGSLDAKATEYWKAIRRRSNVSDDLNKTIAATDLSKEGDWAKYSGTTLVDPTLFNIRRERRNEFIAEGMRMDDLRRWRALDMVKNYQVEGFNLWESVYPEQYVDETGKNLLVQEGTPSETANVSSKKNSKYLRPNQIIKANNQVFDGYTWHTAKYLNPIAIQHMLITASNPSDLSTSPIYQNPQWPTVANAPAED